MTAARPPTLSVARRIGTQPGAMPIDEWYRNEMANRQGDGDQDRRARGDRRETLHPAPRAPRGNTADRMSAAATRRRARPAQDEHPRARRRNPRAPHHRRYLPRQRQGEPPDPDLEQSSGAVS